MAVGAVLPVIDQELGQHSVVPVSPVTGWTDICTAPDVIDVLPTINPNIITRAAQNWMRTLGMGTTLLVRLKYNDDVSAVTTECKVQPFGRTSTKTVGSDSKGLCHRLVDTDGIHLRELTVDLTNDVTDGSYQYTQPVEYDMDGAYEVLVAVNVVFLATGTENDSVIQVKIK